jgi:hypothetical protein
MHTYINVGKSKAAIISMYIEESMQNFHELEQQNLRGENIFEVIPRTHLKDVMSEKIIEIGAV